MLKVKSICWSVLAFMWFVMIGCYNPFAPKEGKVQGDLVLREQLTPEDVLVNEQNGYYIDGAEDLAEKIILLLNEPKKVQNMGNKSLDMVQKFSWNNVVKNILDILNKS